MTIDFNDLDDGLVGATTQADIRKAAHIVNGGEANFACPSCGGKGYKVFGYRNPAPRPCFKCNGRGKVSKGVIAAAKAKETRARNHAEWLEANTELLHTLRGMTDWNNFAREMIAQVDDGRSLTENQIAACQRMIAKVEAAREAKRAQRAEEQAAKSGAVDIAAIERLFATATDNQIKRPVFRAEGVEISKAPDHGRNAGALYVKTNGEYAGKIVSGRFLAGRDAPEDLLGRLQAVAADPTAEAIKYARSTGRCGCCGKELVDPVSIVAGIGPICANKWGLNFRRDMARDELAKEKEA